MSKRRKCALITGITGQDGSFLAEFLLGKGYEVHGVIRRSSSFNTRRIDHIYPRLKLHYGDVTDPLSLDHIIWSVRPHEVYHLAAQSHVKVSFDIPVYTGQVDALGTLHVLEAVRKHVPNAKFYNAATSELFGKVLEIPQKETTHFNPRSPYGAAKIYAYYIVKNYRESYNMFAVNGILFNHESERRGSTFVTSKIINGLWDYFQTNEPMFLGNIYAKRDWGYAKDYVECMWLMLQQDEPEDFVIGTGESHTIKEFIEESIQYFKNNSQPWFPPMEFEWRKDENGREILWDPNVDKIVIGIDEKYYRPTEVDLLLADPSKAKEKLGWEPRVKFKELVKIMVDHVIIYGKI